MRKAVARCRVREPQIRTAIALDIIRLAETKVSRRGGRTSARENTAVICIRHLDSFTVDANATYRQLLRAREGDTAFGQATGIVVFIAHPTSN